MAKAKTATTNKLSVSTVRLSDVANLLRLPPGVKDEKVKKGGKRVKSISITDIPEAGYIESVDSLITLSTEKYTALSKYVIQPFDVVMSIQGTVGTVGIVPEQFSGNWMANISLLVIRFDEKKNENAVALCMFLKSTYGREIIRKLQKGDSIKRINVKEFAAVQIPELSADIRKLSGAAFKEELSIKARIDDRYESMKALRAAYLAG